MTFEIKSDCESWLSRSLSFFLTGCEPNLIKPEMFQILHLLYRDNNKMYLIELLFKIEWDKLYSMLGRA